MLAAKTRSFVFKLMASKSLLKSLLGLSQTSTWMILDSVFGASSRLINLSPFTSSSFEASGIDPKFFIPDFCRSCLRRWAKKHEAQGASSLKSGSRDRSASGLDNAPAESFFGYVKDHLDLGDCNSFEEVEQMVTKEVDYYNYERPQEGLKRMPPIKYRRHLNLKPAFY